MTRAFRGHISWLEQMTVRASNCISLVNRTHLETFPAWPFVSEPRRSCHGLMAHLEAHGQSFPRARLLIETNDCKSVKWRLCISPPRHVLHMTVFLMYMYMYTYICINSHESELHRPLIKGTKLLLKVIQGVGPWFGKSSICCECTPEGTTIAIANLCGNSLVTSWQMHN